ncbi:MAG: hypothetical protein M0Z30_13340 [Actinomycetota bacterium]|nr:hypothetical protein [Actinomycetota bacterium]
MKHEGVALGSYLRSRYAYDFGRQLDETVIGELPKSPTVVLLGNVTLREIEQRVDRP